MTRRSLIDSIAEDPALAKLGPAANLVFDRLLTLTDEAGLCPGEPEVVKGRCFPLMADMTTEMIAGAIDGLVGSELLYRGVYRARLVLLFKPESFQRIQAFRRDYRRRFNFGELSQVVWGQGLPGFRAGLARSPGESASAPSVSVSVSPSPSTSPRQQQFASAVSAPSTEKGYSDLRFVLAAAGIGEPVLSELAESPYLTATAASQAVSGGKANGALVNNLRARIKAAEEKAMKRAARREGDERAEVERRHANSREAEVEDELEARYLALTPTELEAHHAAVIEQMPPRERRSLKPEGKTMKAYVKIRLAASTREVMSC